MEIIFNNTDFQHRVHSLYRDQKTFWMGWWSGGELIACSDPCTGTLNRRSLAERQWLLKMARERVEGRGNWMGLGFLPPQGSYFLQRETLKKNPFTCKELLCTAKLVSILFTQEKSNIYFVPGYFFSSFASQRVLGRSINKDPALFSFRGWGFGLGNPSMAGLATSAGTETFCLS